MFYIAIICIAIGLLLLLFTVVSISPDSRLATRSDRKAPAWFESAPEGASSATGEMGEFAPRIGGGAALSVSTDVASPPGGIRKERVSMAVQERPEEPFLPPERPPLQMREHLIAHGVLFLDSGRRVYLHAGSIGVDSAKILSGLKRVGRCSLVYRDSRFGILSGNVTYSYAADELEQVVFLNRAVAFVPADRSSPVSIILTESTDAIREFIKKYSMVPV
jgi:hypothetical protein